MAMLIVSRALRSAVYVPNAFLALTGVFTATTLHGFLEHPSLGALLGLFLVGAMFLFVVSMIVWTTVRDGRLVRRGMFGGLEGVALERAWIAFTAQTGGKGSVEYVVRASDGASRIELATAWTRRGAARDVRRLRDAFGVVDQIEREPGRTAIAYDLDAWDREQARVREYLRATYSSPRTYVTAALVVALFVAAYAIFFAFYVLRR